MDSALTGAHGVSAQGTNADNRPYSLSFRVCRLTEVSPEGCSEMSLTALIALVTFSSFAVLVFVLRYLVGRERRVLLELARIYSCGRCGAALTEQSVTLADELWERHMQRLLAETKGTPRVVRNLDAVCPACGQRYQHLPETASFKPIETALAFEAS